MLKRKVALALALIMSVSLLATGCGGGGSAEDAAGKTELVVATNQDPKDLHPYKRVSSQILRINNQIFESLVKLGDENNTYVPGLATEWEYVDDGMAMQFTLREDVKFHNGETMTAEDVVYSFQAASKETASSGGIDWLDWDGIKLSMTRLFICRSPIRTRLHLAIWQPPICMSSAKRQWKRWGMALVRSPLALVLI
ncbi:ABC transporter substrate-binding protein [Butyricicoccus sp. OF10-2]|uniref:ABC transporter substrate-binding protein n=1 Tax=Butyricicoccus sp. OF10-2 TaxID=2292298 RepID=UPI000E5D5661|nr:ABC transporter substrate-binding protein [Butyricicoccus sp. OF10-2]RHV83187.1 hypothetical protein DXB00_07965 [Butyricicoccus sp. OF10-2]